MASSSPLPTSPASSRQTYWALRAFSGNCLGGDVKVCMRVGFSKLGIICSHPADIDTSTLIFVCALLHEEAQEEDNYPSTALQINSRVYKGKWTGEGGNSGLLLWYKMGSSTRSLSVGSSK